MTNSQPESFTLNKDNENYFRLLKLVFKLGTPAVHQVLSTHLKDSNPGQAYDPKTRKLRTILRKTNVVKTLKACHSGENPPLTDGQWDLLYPVSTNQGRRHKASEDVSVDDLDITLSIILLRYITRLNPADDDWDPANLNHEEGTVPPTIPAKLMTIKRYRDRLAHAQAAEISDDELCASFYAVKNILISLSDLYKIEDLDSIHSESITDVLRRLNWAQFGEDFDRTLLTTLEEAIRTKCGKLEMPQSSSKESPVDRNPGKSVVCTLL
ncbi:uncharacterized protein LOC106181312 [Lingula anatina]|uniref:Uncharacterized protein LOC106181312 n=1 Tax=Lingula anatina TaxID=7574 RepID=A0A1S3KEP5_LINAN|nr:uncharacterized protein LOC106181312 [Lingula anatina]|eukprot:XP_013421098.1 uncharacterized protein LOC106181312 [Lingula anatina]